MSAKFITVDHDTPMLLPPDLRDWIPQDHMVHFVMDAVAALDLGQARVNHRGSGSAQWPPQMMLALLIYSYATGVFSSRRIERATHDSVATRFLCGDRHPDHDSICKFRRQNHALLQSSFHQVLQCAARAKILRVGDITVASDGTKIHANASKHSAMSHGHAIEQIKRLDDEINQLLAKAEQADSTPLQDGLTLPKEIQRREDRKKQITAAVEAIEARAKERHAREQAEHLETMRRRADKEQATGRKPPGRPPQPPAPGPQPKDQHNFTDPESRIMPAGGGSHFEQSYNAQATVEIESRLIISQRTTDAPNDKQQLQANLEALSPVIQSVRNILADSGYHSEAAIEAIESSHDPVLKGATVYAAVGRSGHGRSVAELEKRPDPPAPGAGASGAERMRHRLGTQAGKALYAQRKQTIEPVFGIIKSAMGFRQFSLRGLAKAALEWPLVTLSYNLKRLHHLGAALKPA